MASYGPKREEAVLQPVSGKAFPLYRGEVLRIVQLEGEQCVDFNAFNLHDYKEYFSASNTRANSGFHLKRGDLLWSVHSRNRPMYEILEMPQTCVSDLIAGRCKAANHYAEGFSPDSYGTHTNCQDTLAACIGEYGLTPDDVHDSCNLWYNTEWDSKGRYWSTRNTGRKGDYVDLLSVFDTLAVPVICGTGDTGIANNFSFKPIQVQIFSRSRETEAHVESYEIRYASMQRKLESFKRQTIKADRELQRDPKYVPEFVRFPLSSHRIPVELNEDEYKCLNILKENGLGKTDEEALRAALFTWYIQSYRHMPIRGRLR
jgi:uncharacterized protein YcgI (DUF1989 family)